MKKLELLVNNPLTETFGLTLIHSVWQGMILVFIALFFIWFQSISYKKVQIGLLIMLIQMAASFSTFFYLLPQKDVLHNNQTINPPTTLNLVLVETLESPEMLINFLNKSNLLAAFWFLGFLVLVFRFVGGLIYTYQLKYSHHTDLNEKAILALNSICEKINKQFADFQVFESSAVHSAMVIGHLKPIILLPVSLVTQLSIEQLELILAHEIAHIQRKDFLINLIQSLFNIIYFFHPAYWLLSRHISIWREHACDDWAAEITGNRILLAKTLAQIQMRQAEPRFALSFAGKRTPMLDRIKRLMGENPRYQKSRFLALGIVSLAILTFGFINKNKDTDESETLFENINSTDFQNNIDSKLPDMVASKDTDILKVNDIFISRIDEEIKLNSDNYHVKINGKGIYVDGEKLNLSLEQKEILERKLKSINESQANINRLTKQINEHAESMNKYASEINENINFSGINTPGFKEYQEKMEAKGQEIAKLAAEFQNKIQALYSGDQEWDKSAKDGKLNKKQKEKELLEKEFEGKMKVLEKEMQSYELKIEGFDEKMKEIQAKIEVEIEVPMKDLEIKIQAIEPDIERESEQIESDFESLIELLPENVRRDIKESANKNQVYAPRPPQPPVYPANINQPVAPNPPVNIGVVKPPKPPKEFKELKPTKPAKPAKPAKPEKPLK